MNNSILDLVEKDIFELTDLDHLPEEKKRELFEKAEETILNGVMLRVASLLEEDSKIDHLKNLMLAGDQQAVLKYLEGQQIDLDAIMAEETLAYKAQIASLTEALRPQPTQN